MIMQKLSRQWRKSDYDEDDKFTLPTRDDFRPIDSQEQEELVRSLEKVQTQQSLLWRAVFSGLLLCYVAFLLYSIYQQAYYPWELRYHAYFIYEVDAWTIIAADWAAILACLMTIKGLLHEANYCKRWLWSSCCIGMIVAVFWLHHMLRLARFRWDILWLPLGPLSGAGVCIYVDYLLTVSSEEVRKLRGYMYAYKAR
ncbi:putative dnaJ -like protein subfamily C GRV2-like isoform X1 [Capsicum annuum]|uniref:Uncharacterized protein n=1 Tax=Capsicum annuum TaxID=4072 RepID=A0A1U8DS29_CAPAN|nr:uncharacterized protein LOC107839005 isoform X1 [Capsicum annuum]KAF3654069.1 putative dnaJ -like protein subfamily C GRV2-like isoform X1 [Capsicum annuum]PHT74268.1 hypothetical protein T459_21545 [Capsicum annuum]